MCKRDDEHGSGNEVSVTEFSKGGVRRQVTKERVRCVEEKSAAPVARLLARNAMLKVWISNGRLGRDRFGAELTRPIRLRYS